MTDWPLCDDDLTTWLTDWDTDPDPGADYRPVTDLPDIATWQEPHHD